MEVQASSSLMSEAETNATATVSSRGAPPARRERRDAAPTEASGLFVVDIRSEASYATARWYAAGAAHIPLDQLYQRMFELPAKRSRLVVVVDVATVRAIAAVSAPESSAEPSATAATGAVAVPSDYSLPQHSPLPNGSADVAAFSIRMDKLFFGWHVAAVLLAPSPSSVASDSPFESEGEALKGLDLSSWVLPPPACETAVAEIVTHVQWVWAAKPLPSARHWAPSAFVVEAADRIEAANGGIRGGVAMDIGCGSGRDAAYLASRGWTIIGIDNRMPFLGKALQLGRTVAPTPSAPLEREAAAAISLACTSSTTPATSAVTSTGAVDGLCCDATRPLPLRPGQLDLIVCVRFLVRPLLPLLAHLLAPGGWLCYSHFVDGVQHSAVGTPASPAHYVMHGELRGKCVPPAGSGIEVDVVVDREDLLADGRPVSNVLLRRRLA